MRASTITAPWAEHDHRVEVQLRDLGQGLGQRAHAQQDVLERGHVGRARRGSPPAAGRSQAADHLARVVRSVSGVRRTATSFSSSTSTPPAPQATTGRTRVVHDRRPASRPRRHHPLDQEARGRVPGRASRSAISRRRGAPRSAPGRPSRTAPSSVLCSRPGAIALSATAPPSASAPRPPRRASAAMRLSTSGSP